MLTMYLYFIIVKCLVIYIIVLFILRFSLTKKCYHLFSIERKCTVNEKFNIFVKSLQEQIVYFSTDCMNFFTEEFFSCERKFSFIFEIICCVLINANEPFQSSGIAVLLWKRDILFFVKVKWCLWGYWPSAASREKHACSKWIVKKTIIISIYNKSTWNLLVSLFFVLLLLNQYNIAHQRVRWVV